MKNAIYLNFFMGKLVVYLEHEKLLGCFHLIAWQDKYHFFVRVILLLYYIRISNEKNLFLVFLLKNKV